MNTIDAILLRRSIRKFRPEPVPAACLTQILGAARLYPSGGNLQPVRFALVTTPTLTDAIFADLKWAMYLPEYSIGSDERPAAYIILLRDERISKGCGYDIGAASTMVMLAAVEQGLATCPIGNFHAKKLRALLGLSEALHPELVIALGYPAQESHVVPMADTVRYTQAPDGSFLVPKRDLQDILVFDDTQCDERRNEQ